MSSAYGIKAIKPTDAEHVLGFANARSTTDDSLFEIWNGSSVSALVLTVDKDGQIQGVDSGSGNSGTVSRPTYSFEGAKNTGIYYVHSGTTVRTAIAGTDRLTVAATGVTVANDLTVGGTLTVSGATAIELGDNEKIAFGDAPDYWIGYSSSATRIEFITTNKGGGTDGVIFSVDDGDDDVDFHGNILVTGTITSSGTITGTLATAAQGNVTSLGTLSALTVSGAASFEGATTIGNASGDALTIHPAAWTLSNAVTVTGTWANLGAVTTADINGGTIDGAVIGGASAAAITGTTLVANTSLTIASDTAGGAITGVKNEADMASNSATKLVTQASLVSYVATQISAEDLDTAGDSGTGAVDLNSQSLTIAGGAGIDTTASGQTVTIAGEAASLTNAGIVEIATAAETNTGNDATRAVSPDGLDEWTGSAQVTTLGTVSSGTWSGTAIAANKGGTGQTSYTEGDILYATGSAAVGKLTALAAGKILRAAGTGAAPAWTTATFADTYAAGDLVYAGSTNTVSGLTKGSSNQVLTSSGSVPQWVTQIDNAALPTNVAVAGTLSANGNVTLGNDATADTLTLNVRVNTDLVPSSDGTRDLGSSTLEWADLWIDGTAHLDVVDIDGAVQIDSTVTVGVDDTGYDVKFFGATSGAYMLWDESADDLKLVGAAGLTVAGNIDVDGTTNLDVVDIDGAVDVAGVVTANAGVVVDNITIDGQEIDVSSGDLTIDVAGDIILDADGGDIKIQDSGTNIGYLSNSSSDFAIEAQVQDKDIVFKGNDGGAGINALTLDMSGGGWGVFNTGVTCKDGIYINNADGSATVGYLYNDSNDFIVRSYNSNNDMVFKGNDGGSVITALTLDMSNAGAATFNSGITSLGGITQTNGSADADILNSMTNSATSMMFGVSDSSANRFVNSSNNYAFWGTTSAHGIEIATNNTVRFIIDSSGDASFGHALQVTGNLTTIANTALGNGAGDICTVVGTLNWNDGGDSALSLKNAGTNATAIYAASGDILYIGSNDTAAMSFDSSGNTTAMGNLTVGDNSADDVAIFFNGNGADFYAGIDDSDDDFKIGVGATVGSGNLGFFMQSDTGNVNIGSDNFAGYQLTVQGDDETLTANFGSNLSDVSDWNGVAFGNTTSPKAAICFKRTSNYSTGDLFILNNGDHDSNHVSLADNNDRVARFGSNKVTEFYSHTYHQGDIYLTAQQKVYLDGGGNTYIWEPTGDVVEVVANNVASARFHATSLEMQGTRNLILNDTGKLYFDGGSDTYIMQDGDNEVKLYANGLKMYLTGNTARFPGAYANTTASAVNMFVSSDGDLARSTSSLRYKKDIEDYSLESSRAVIAGLRPITYRGKDDEADERKHLGFIAEEVHEVEQQLVTYIDLNGEKAPDYVEYDRLVAPLVSVVKDLMTRIEALET